MQAAGLWDVTRFRRNRHTVLSSYVSKTVSPTMGRNNLQNWPLGNGRVYKRVSNRCTSPLGRA